MTTRIVVGDALASLREMPSASVHCIVTSPPYFGLRSYLPDDHPDKAQEMGSEPTLAEFIAALVGLMREARRVLRDDGVAFVNMGDAYARDSQVRWDRTMHTDAGWKVGQSMRNAPNMVRDGGMKPKDLMMVPARLAIALQDDGWFLRSQMPWIKRSCMPESVVDRPTSAIEYVFLLTKRPAYFWDAEAVKQKGAIGAGVRAAKGSNVRSDLKDVNGRPPEYWEYTGTRNFRNSDLFFSSLEAPHGLLTDAAGEPIALDVNTQAFKGSHFAVFPEKLVEPLIRAGTSEKGCCPACGAPWGRVLGDAKPTGGRGAGNGFKRDTRLSYADADGARGDDTVWVPKTRETTGWQPSCACPPAEPVPCVVLDPFGGAGTTGMVANRLGRDAILLELNPEYAAMAETRLAADRGELPIEGVGLFAATG